MLVTTWLVYSIAWQGQQPYFEHTSWEHCCDLVLHAHNISARRASWQSV